MEDLGLRSTSKYKFLAAGIPHGWLLWSDRCRSRDRDMHIARKAQRSHATLPITCMKGGHYGVVSWPTSVLVYEASWLSSPNPRASEEASMVRTAEDTQILCKGGQAFRPSGSKLGNIFKLSSAFVRRAGNARCKTRMQSTIW